MKAKDKHREKLLKHLSNPANEWPNRDKMATQVLGFKNGRSIHNTFKPEELDAIEAEARSIRRRRYAPRLTKVEDALLREAESGDVQAIKLALQYFEDWAPATRVENTGPGGGPIQAQLTMAPEVAEAMARAHELLEEEDEE